eukprot:g24721.t1
MCKKVDCSNCAKSTWAGCGQHVQTALKDVPEADRCPGWKSGQCTQPKKAMGTDLVLPPNASMREGRRTVRLHKFGA